MNKEKLLNVLKKIAIGTYSPRMQLIWLKQLIEDIEKGKYDT